MMFIGCVKSAESFPMYNRIENQLLDTSEKDARNKFEQSVSQISSSLRGGCFQQPDENWYHPLVLPSIPSDTTS